MYYREGNRKVDAYRPMFIVINEDDHFDFAKETYKQEAAIASYTPWGYFDFRMKDEGFKAGFPIVPLDWHISSDRKRTFFIK